MILPSMEWKLPAGAIVEDGSTWMMAFLRKDPMMLFVRSAMRSKSWKMNQRKRVRFAKIISVYVMRIGKKNKMFFG